MVELSKSSTAHKSNQSSDFEEIGFDNDSENEYNSQDDEF